VVFLILASLFLAEALMTLVSSGVLAVFFYVLALLKWV
jgi:hypothetical protein